MLTFKKDFYSCINLCIIKNLATTWLFGEFEEMEIVFKLS